MCVDATAKVIGLGNVVGANGDEAAVGDFKFTVELDKALGLATVLGAKIFAAED